MQNKLLLVVTQTSKGFLGEGIKAVSKTTWQWKNVYLPNEYFICMLLGDVQPNWMSTHSSDITKECLIIISW